MAEKQDPKKAAKIVQTFIHTVLSDAQELSHGKVTEHRLAKELRDNANLNMYDGALSTSIAGLTIAVQLAMSMMDKAGMQSVADEYIKILAGTTRIKKQDDEAGD